MDECFAKNNGKCSVIKYENYFCKGCRFYKTKQQYARDRLKYFEKEKEFSLRIASDHAINPARLEILRQKLIEMAGGE